MVATTEITGDRGTRLVQSVLEVFDGRIMDDEEETENPQEVQLDPAIEAFLEEERFAPKGRGGP